MGTFVQHHEYILVERQAARIARRERIKEMLFEQQLDRELEAKEDEEWQLEVSQRRLIRSLKRLEVTVRREQAETKAREARIQQNALASIREMYAQNDPLLKRHARRN